jgi:hypothetical protein
MPGVGGNRLPTAASNQQMMVSQRVKQGITPDLDLVFQ